MRSVCRRLIDRGGAIIIVTAWFVSGCAQDPDYREKATASPDRSGRSAAQAQIERGGEVYANRCSRCHGDAGQGTAKAPLLVGAGALPLNPRPDSERGAQFRTALDIAVFATQNMPPSQRARESMEEDEYWAVLAFALNANGVQLEDAVGPDNAGDIVLH